MSLACVYFSVLGLRHASVVCVPVDMLSTVGLILLFVYLTDPAVSLYDCALRAPALLLWSPVRCVPFFFALCGSLAGSCLCGAEDHRTAVSGPHPQIGRWNFLAVLLTDIALLEGH